MRRVLIALAVTCAIAGAAAADVTLYDTTLGGAATRHDNPFGPAPLLDDIGVAQPSAKVTAMEFGFTNTSAAAEDVDAVVTFWDNMNVAPVNPTDTVNTTSLGSFRRHIGSIAGSATGSTGLFSLVAPINLPDSSFGVQINYVLTTTNTLSELVATLADNLPAVGTTVDQYWSDDQNPGGVFQGQDAVFPNPFTPSIHENLYLRIDGTVPEPSAFAAIGVACAAGMCRRHRQKLHR
jgi:hypothetical protein